MSKKVVLHGLCDMHCHVLPHMDDGCASVEQSLQVLRMNRRQNIDRVVATSHYYPTEPISKFLDRREKAVTQLYDAIQSQDDTLPSLTLGAEVAYHTGLLQARHIERLCIGSSGYLLLELPFRKWPSQVFTDIHILRSTLGITPIIAHLERYLKVQDTKTVNRLLEMDVLVQMNAGYLLNFWTQRKAKHLMKSGVVQLLGSDCHNTTNRPPNLGKGYEYLCKSGMTDIAEDLIHNSHVVLSDA